jgi:arylsulfatase A-like enzyme
MSAYAWLVAAGSTPANIVFVLTDDQDAFTTGYDAKTGIKYMPKTNSLIRNEGALFLNHLLATPLCAPSRSVILTGQYPHNTEVFLNSPTHGAFKFWALSENKSVGLSLQRAGYTTFFAGKYMNGYGHFAHVPLGWSDWHGFTDVTYFAPEVSVIACSVL